MKLSPKHLYRITAIFVVLVCLSFLAHNSLSFRMTDDRAREFFSSRNQPIIIETITTDGHPVHFADTGGEDRPAVLFLHGAPGGWNAFIDFMADSSLRTRARMLSADRPGYGYSGYGDPITSLAQQSRLLRPLLEHEQETIIVGHSLGAPVAVRLAMDYPDLVDGLILVGPSIDPTMEKEEWFRYPMRTAFGHFLLPGSIWSTNEEIFFLKEELQAMLPGWEELTIPVTVIQGMEDTLVPMENAFFAERMLDPDLLDVQLEEGVNHFIPWNRPDLITAAIHRHLDRF